MSGLVFGFASFFIRARFETMFIDCWVSNNVDFICLKLVVWYGFDSTVFSINLKIKFLESAGRSLRM